MATAKPRIVFLCTGNSCRSQMAEGLLRHLASDRYESLSAGAQPAGYVHPNAVRVMDELGIDISHHHSKSLHEFLPPTDRLPHTVISVCAAAEAECPAFPASVQHLHWPFDDPAAAEGTQQEMLSVFRSVRDEIRAMIERHLLPTPGEQAG